VILTGKLNFFSAAESSTFGIVNVFKGETLNFEHNKCDNYTPRNSDWTYTQAPYAAMLASQSPCYSIVTSGVRMNRTKNLRQTLES